MAPNNKVHNKVTAIITIMVLVVLLNEFNWIENSNLILSYIHVSSTMQMQNCDNIDIVVSVDNVNNTLQHDEHVIVTGAAGFIGSHVASICAKTLNMNVIIIDDLSGGFLSNIPDDKNVIFEHGSLLNTSFVDNIFKKYKKIKYIYHLAAYASVGLSHHIRVFNYDTNFVASTRLINYAINYNVSTFIFTSSINIYGSGPYDGFKGEFDETMHTSPQEPYGISKEAVEHDLEAAHKYFGLNYVIFRPHAVYGPNQNIFDRYRNVVGIFMYSILNNEPMRIFGDGTQTRSFSYICDVAPYISVSPLYDHLLNKKFNIGSEQITSLNQLVMSIIKVFIVDNKLIHLIVAKNNSLNIFTEYYKIKSHIINYAFVIHQLFNNHKIVRHIETRYEVFNAEASQKYFNCMFKINKTQITELEIGLNKTLNWVIQNNYNLSNGEKLNNFHQINFDAIEISKGLPNSWERIRTGSKAEIHRLKQDIEP